MPVTHSYAVVLTWMDLRGWNLIWLDYAFTTFILVGLVARWFGYTLHTVTTVATVPRGAVLVTRLIPRSHWMILVGWLRLPHFICLCCRYGSCLYVAMPCVVAVTFTPRTPVDLRLL